MTYRHRPTVGQRSIPTRITVMASAVALMVAACGTGTGTVDVTVDVTGSVAAVPRTVTLLAYDSFPAEDAGVVDALAEFTAETGVAVEILNGGDAGTMTTKAVLTAGNPEGDVLWGIDTTLLTRALEADVFEPYVAAADGAIPAELLALGEGVVTPVDTGDVCLNYDIAWFAERGLEPPATLAELIEPAYADLLVVQNPASSSPGLAFLLATIAQFGDDWADFWADLRDNGVDVVDSWRTAYYERFSGSGGGERPLVVSYASSPPAEVFYADPPRDDAPTASIDATCFRQVEFAGVLRGTDAPDEARALVDFLVGERFQREIPLSLFVFPVREGVALPEVFVEHATVAADPLSLPASDIAARQQEWIEEWTTTVLG